MIEKIRSLEKEADKLDPGQEERMEMTERAVRYAQHFLSDLPHKKTFVRSGDNGKGLLDAPFSEDPEQIEPLLSLIEQEVDYPGLNPASPGHLGYIPGSGVYPAALGDFLAAVSNRYAGIFFAAPGAVRMENMCIRWMCDLIGYPDSAAGNLTSGGSIANLTALVTARDSAGLKSSDFDKCVIYCTRQVHHSAVKAIGFAGLGDTEIRYIKMNDSYRMRAEDLETQIEKDKKAGLLPFFIFASAGTTDVGAVDPLESMAEIAEKNNIWFHVDAAYGGFFLLTDHGRNKMSGIDRADSVVIDPHKGLFLPFGLGALLVKDGEKLYDSQHMAAHYMQDSFHATEETSPADLSPELTKHFRGLRMWLPLKLYGVRPFRAALDEKLLLARYFYEQIQKIDNIEVGPEPELSILFFRYVPGNGDADAFNEQLVREIQKDGRVFLSSTRINDTFYIRTAILSYRTHLEQIELALEIIKEKIELLKEKV